MSLLAIALRRVGSLVEVVKLFVKKIIHETFGSFMSHPATLCIIDVQVPFHAAGRKSLLDNVVRLVKNAKRRRAGIVLVEFEGFGSTHIAIQQAIGSYEKCITTIKSDCDGSEEIIDACCKRGFNTRKIVICGVETNYHVMWGFVIAYTYQIRSDTFPICFSP